MRSEPQVCLPTEKLFMAMHASGVSVANPQAPYALHRTIQLLGNRRHPRNRTQWNDVGVLYAQMGPELQLNFKRKLSTSDSATGPPLIAHDLNFRYCDGRLCRCQAGCYDQPEHGHDQLRGRIHSRHKVWMAQNFTLMVYLEPQTLGWRGYRQLLSGSWHPESWFLFADRLVIAVCANRSGPAPPPPRNVGRRYNA